MPTPFRLHRPFLAVFAVISLAVASACSVSGVEGQGEPVRQTRTVSGFSKIEVSQQGDVEVRQGAAFALVVEAQPNLQELIETKVSGNTLVISSSKSINATKPIHYYLTLPALEGISVEGAGNVDVKDIFSPEKLSLEVSGAGNVSGNFIAKKIDIELSGAGAVQLKGSADELTAEVSGAGGIEAADLAVKTADLEVSGAGGITTQVSDGLDAKVSGVGSIQYKGNPSHLKQDVSGVGKVVKL